MLKIKVISDILEERSKKLPRKSMKDSTRNNMEKKDKRVLFKDKRNSIKKMLSKGMKKKFRKYRKKAK